MEGAHDCDAFSPVTWHVDRKCHLISTWSMDQLCLSIKNRPGMKRRGSVCKDMPFDAIDEDGCCFPDTKTGGSRGVMVDEELAADNYAGNKMLVPTVLVS